LYSIPDREWNPTLLGSIVGADTVNEDVQRMMGAVERDPRKSAGKIGMWFQDRYGFASGESGCRFEPDTKLISYYSLNRLRGSLLYGR
jgi:hypothetical protein